MMRIHFRPGIASTIATAIIFPCLMGLGFWQLDRAAGKIALYEKYQFQSKAPVVDLDDLDTDNTANVQWRPIRAEGRYHGPNILLDNRTRDGRAGYEIYTPFQTRNDAIILIARGWVAATDERSAPKMIMLPSGDQILRGRVGNAPWGGIDLPEAARIEHLNDGLLRVQRIRYDALSEAVKRELLPFVVYLDPDALHGYDRRWPIPTSGAGKHTAYAVQWFAMATVLIILYVKINLPPRLSSKS